MTTVIITGINSGLGNAFFEHFINNSNYFIIGISRRITSSQKALLEADKFAHVLLDLMTLNDTSEQLNLGKYVSKESKAFIFINNAATIRPINAIGQFNDQDIIKSVTVNTMAPLLIANHILSLNLPNLKLINISSGAAKRPIVGWSLYCATKSANQLFFDTLKEQELNNDSIEVYNIDPGVLDSDMQEFIRNTDTEVFPMVNDFIQLKKDNQLKAPKLAALEILKECNVS
jgi:benzil reductase ((S)-benzoin forming)